MELAAGLKVKLRDGSVSFLQAAHQRTAYLKSLSNSPPGGLLNIHALIKQFYRCYLPGDDKSTAPGRALHADKNLSVCVCVHVRVKSVSACEPINFQP